MKKLGLVALIEASFFAALAFIFDLLPSIRLSPSISISFAMVPIFLLAFRWGFKVSALAGFIWGLLQVALGDAAGSILTPLQGFIEYFVAFAFTGFAGFFYKPVQAAFRKGKKTSALFLVIMAVFVGSVARYFWHFIAGFIFWGEYAPEGMNPVWFSLVANGVTALGAAVLCSILLVLVLSSAPALILRKTTAPVPSSKQAS
ncbi:energy-coupled thiamine transporter ThiT [Virgibacillus senegalensis]|uniref:energy-coupled thiamine transporter ThiT n=1 Tax=Virgibacillus senegalensis TaxID=1499679 RepID=UPI00069F2856|nr:energy-coupled thiamine transporter ThiT [Virgibacillus senegalensis]